MTKSINMLTSVKTKELSLVKRGANNKRFALTKGHDMPFKNLLDDVLSTEAEGEANMVKTLKSAGASDEACEVAVATFRIQSGFADKLSKTEFAQVTKASGYVTKADNPFAPDEDHEDDEDSDKAKKAKDKADKEAKAEAEKKEKAEKSLPADMPVEMKKAFDEQAAELEEIRKTANESAAEVTSLRKEAEKRDYVKKCEENFAHVPGMSIEEMGSMLQKAYEVSEDFGKQLESQWLATTEAISKSALLQTQGGHSVSNDTATGKLEAIAKGYVKADPSMTSAVAFTKAMEDNPELYDAYLSDNPKQRGA